jgi:hypothetical protein
MQACNNFVGCSPFEQKAVQAEVRSGFGTVKQKTTLSKLVVVVPGRDTPNNHDYTEGDIIWVRGDGFKLNWGKEEFEEGGKTFILVPVSSILLHETKK